MEMAYELHLFAVGFRLDLALSNIHKGFRDSWRPKAKDRVFHIITEWLTLEGTSGSHLIECPVQAGSHTTLLWKC